MDNKLKKTLEKLIPPIIVLSIMIILIGVIPLIVRTIKYNNENYTLGERIRMNGLEFIIVSYDDFIEEINYGYAPYENRMSDYDIVLGDRTSLNEFYAPDLSRLIKHDQKIAKLVWVDDELTEMIIDDLRLQYYFPKDIDNLENIEKIVIKGSISTVFDYGFMKGNIKLKMIEITDYIIDYYFLSEAFMDCINLKKIECIVDYPISGENVVMGYNAFSNAISLKEIDVKLLLPGAFHGCNFTKFTDGNENIGHNNSNYYLKDNCIYTKNNMLVYINNDKYLKKYKFVGDTYIRTSCVFPPQNIEFNLSQSDIYYFDENGFILRKKTPRYDDVPRYEVLVHIPFGYYKKLDLSNYQMIASYAGVGIKVQELILDYDKEILPYAFQDTDISKIEMKSFPKTARVKNNVKNPIVRNNLKTIDSLIDYNYKNRNSFYDIVVDDVLYNYSGYEKI